MYSTASAEKTGVFVYPETQKIIVHGFTGVDEILDHIPELYDPSHERPLRSAIHETQAYLTEALTGGVILDSQGMKHDYDQSLYPAKLREALASQGIVYMNGAAVWRNLRIPLTELNSGSSDMVYFLSVGLADVLRYNAEKQMVYNSASRAEHAPMLSTMVKILSLEGRRIFAKHAPSKSIMSPTTVVRQDIYQRAWIATERAAG